MRNRTSVTRLSSLVCGAIALMMAGAVDSSFAQTESFDGPTFRKGLWRFARTVEYPNHRVVVRQQEMTRCVDPTNAMKGTFASPHIGSCRSAKAERVDNRYTFANRCDYMGPVRTDITVHSEEAYVEVNIPKFGNFLQVDRVLAQRIGDCDDVEQEASSRQRSPQ